jgi:pheromone shutdown protein TraB
MLQYKGLLIGIAVFLMIGIFHPLVIKAEYYWGIRSWWIFFIAGLLSAVASLLVINEIISILLGVLAFSCFWSIREIFQQKRRVEKGWFPKNPKREK